MTSKTLTDRLRELSLRDTLLDVKDTARVVSITPWWVRELIANGELRAINVGGPGKSARWRIDPEDLVAFMLERENRPRDLLHRAV